MDDSLSCPALRRTPPPALATGPAYPCEHITLIGRDLDVSPGITSDSPAIIAGAVHGDVRCPWIEIEESARIHGTVEAEDVIVEGEVAGSVYGRNVVLAATARISGDVVCEKLHAAAGASVSGRTHPSLQLSRDLMRDLARIARNPDAANTVDPSSLQALRRKGLLFERYGSVFVSIYGHLELGRRWARNLGIVSDLACDISLTARRPPHIRAYRRAVKHRNAPLSVIADDVRFGGGLETGGELRIHGTVAGDVRCRSCATGDASRIGGSLAADSVTVAGHVRGTVSASYVLLLTTARVEGPVHFGTIEVRGGARYGGGRQVMPLPPGGATHTSDTASLIGTCLGEFGEAA